MTLRLGGVLAYKRGQSQSVAHPPFARIKREYPLELTFRVRELPGVKVCGCEAHPAEDVIFIAREDLGDQRRSLVVSADLDLRDGIAHHLRVFVRNAATGTGDVEDENQDQRTKGEAHRVALLRAAVISRGNGTLQPVKSQRRGQCAPPETSGGVVNVSYEREKNSTGGNSVSL